MDIYRCRGVPLEEGRVDDNTRTGGITIREASLGFGGGPCCALSVACLAGGLGLGQGKAEIAVAEPSELLTLSHPAADVVSPRLGRCIATAFRVGNTYGCSVLLLEMC
jgi:hypothetical protein